MEDAIKQKRVAQSTVWRAKKCTEICNAHIEGMKNNERYNELVDSNNMLDELVGQVEAFVTEQKEVKAKAKAKKEKEDS
jgi:phosphohistidine phosphatase SixA